jgi:endoglucanase
VERLPGRAAGRGGTHKQRGQLAAGFQQLAELAAARDRPILVGEFGSSNNADMASRARWTRTNRELAERHGFSWGYRSFGPSFALYDLHADRWNRELLDALST